MPRFSIVLTNESKLVDPLLELIRLRGYTGNLSITSVSVQGKAEHELFERDDSVYKGVICFLVVIILYSFMRRPRR